MSKCLITGSCGFLGSNFIRKAIYNKSNFELASIDRVTNSSNLHNIYANKGHQFYIGDITDSHFVNLIFEIEKPDVIIHAAEIKEADTVIQNIKGTQILLEACARYGASRFIYLSTNEIEEGQTLYAASKAASELFIQAFVAENKNKITVDILRLCNIFGPRQSTKNFIPNLIKKILQNQPLILNGEGQRIRDWLYVEDVCNLLIMLLNTKPDVNSWQVYQVSGGYEFSDLEIFYEVVKNLGQGIDLLSFDKEILPTETSRSYSSELLSQLGWKPNWKIKSAITQSCNWYLNNRWFINL